MGRGESRVGRGLVAGGRGRGELRGCVECGSWVGRDGSPNKSPQQLMLGHVVKDNMAHAHLRNGWIAYTSTRAPGARVACVDTFRQ